MVSIVLLRLQAGDKGCIDIPALNPQVCPDQLRLEVCKSLTGILARSNTQSEFMGFMENRVLLCLAAGNLNLLPSSFLHHSCSLAPPSVSVPQKWALLEKETTFECRASGFYPPPVSFSWAREEQVIQPPFQVEGELSPDGYYTAVNNLTIYPSREDQNVTFSCRVSHRGSNQELDFQLNVTREFVSKWKSTTLSWLVRAVLDLSFVLALVELCFGTTLIVHGSQNRRCLKSAVFHLTYLERNHLC
uniref:Ig-like domain-containing protein n=1 Tax=Fundulus heteroclitus TaxID=8078 RepID=A0A3Q2QNL8_FUNHE